MCVRFEIGATGFEQMLWHFFAARFATRLFVCVAFVVFVVPGQGGLVGLDNVVSGVFLTCVTRLWRLTVVNRRCLRVVFVLKHVPCSYCEGFICVVNL